MSHGRATPASPRAGARGSAAKSLHRHHYAGVQRLRREGASILDRQRRGTTLLGATVLEQLAHARRVDELAGVGLRERGVELCGAVLLVQRPELPGDVAEVLPAVGAAEQKFAAVRRGVLQAVHAAVLVRRALLGDECLDVGKVLYAVVAASTTRTVSRSARTASWRRTWVCGTE